MKYKKFIILTLKQIYLGLWQTRTLFFHLCCWQYQYCYLLYLSWSVTIYSSWSIIGFDSSNDLNLRSWICNGHGCILCCVTKNSLCKRLSWWYWNIQFCQWYYYFVFCFYLYKCTLKAIRKIPFLNVKHILLRIFVKKSLTFSFCSR